MTAMTIIIAVVVFWTVLILGMLVGMSVHREASRRKVHRQGLRNQDLHEQRDELHEAWTELLDQRRELELIRRRTLGN